MPSVISLTRVSSPTWSVKRTCSRPPRRARCRAPRRCARRRCGRRCGGAGCGRSCPRTPRPSSRQILGSWVVLPEPVSPATITTWWSRIAAAMLVAALADRQLGRVLDDGCGGATLEQSEPCGGDVLLEPVQGGRSLTRITDLPDAVEPAAEPLSVADRHVAQLGREVGDGGRRRCGGLRGHDLPTIGAPRVPRRAGFPRPTGRPRPGARCAVAPRALRRPACLRRPLALRRLAFRARSPFRPSGIPAGRTSDEVTPHVLESASARTSSELRPARAVGRSRPASRRSDVARLVTL